MASAGVIDEGRVYIRDGKIRAVLNRREPRPSDFSGAPVVKVGGTIFPGLIELHNHLSYNAIPLWDVPRRYPHSGSWQGTDEYRTAVTKPAQVLANTAGNVEALVRFVECRCLLGGVTTTQGPRLYSKPGIEVAYEGLVRNVERPLLEELPAAGAKITDPDKDLEKYLKKQQNRACYLQHLSEGVNETARKQFTRLQRGDGTWALHGSFSGIHSTALTADDFQVLAAHGASIVWSPLSNLLLYGQTTDVQAARQAGLPIALGSDWAPSGTKNLIGELKVAWLVSEGLGGLFTHHELCQMVTSTPAEILGWHNDLGTIEAERLADLIVIDDKTGDPYQQLVEARETSITLVVIGGIPRVGQARMMHRFGPGTEEIEIGYSRRVLDLSSEADPDPLQGISLQEATDRLRDSLIRLPELAEQLDAALAAGWAPGRELVLGFRDSLADVGLPEDWQAPPFTVLLDFEEQEVARDPSFALAAGDLADWVDPMELEGITVPNDRGFFRSLARAANLPSFVKTGLPPLYGESVPSIAFLDARATDFDASLLASRELREAFVEARALSQADRLRIIEQATALLEQYYVHLPMKRAMHAIDPVQRLRVLRFEVEQEDPERLGLDIDFHRQMAGILNSVRDLHTTYRLPLPYRRLVAWLPYLIEECTENGRSRFIVSKVVGEAGPKSFEEGVEVLYWNGTPIERYVEQLAREMPGGNTAARRANAVNSLTIRPLVRGNIPDEDWVLLRYRSAAERPKTFEFRQPWLVFEPSRRRRVLRLDDGDAPVTALGIDHNTDDIHQVKKLLYAASLVKAEEAALLRRKTPVPPVSEDEIPTTLPTIFRAGFVTRGDRRETTCGYIRIFSFNINDADLFVNEFERLLQIVADYGLIIDVRGNAGGLIHAAERILELISPLPIDPQRAQFINTPANLTLCRRHAPSRQFADFSLENWIESMETSVATGATHSLGYPLTSPGTCNERGQRHQGPVVLIIDGLCYSATDMFAAGFQDHRLGDTIGTSAITGAGGANVWSHGLLRQLAGPQSGLKRLPGGADLRVAIRRTLRVGPNAGELLEDLGVRPDVLHQLTRDDLLHGNRDLIERAVQILESCPKRRLSLAQQDDCIQISATNVDWVEATAVGRPLRARNVTEGQASIGLDELPEGSPQLVEVRGMVGNRVVARARMQVEPL
jgi:cytosine/adenosine deaminase-related metal-dependent hydrolase